MNEAQVARIHNGKGFVAEGFDLRGRLDDADESDGGEADAEHAGGDGDDVEEVIVKLVVAVVILERDAAGFVVVVEHGKAGGRKVFELF